MASRWVSESIARGHANPGSSYGCINGGVVKMDGIFVAAPYSLDDRYSVEERWTLATQDARAATILITF